MTFFYDLNKRMAELSQKQTLSEGAVAERATGDYSAKKAAAGKDIGKPGKNFEKIAKSAGERYGSKAAGERVAGAVLNKLRGKNESQLDELSPDTIASYQKKAYPQATTTGPKSDQRTAGIVRSLGRPTNEGDMDESALQAYLGKKKYGGDGMKALQQAGRDGASKEKMAQIRARHDKMDEADMEEGNKFAHNVLKAKASGLKQADLDGDGKMEKVLEKLSPAKQKSFAALAPPRDKITFADKIAGAKQEVEEMLGDVAAEAMRAALGKNKKVVADEGFPTVAGARAELNKRKVGDVTHGAKHDTEETPTGRRVTRRTDAQGYSVGSETDDEGNVKSTEKRKAGRPKGADKGPERVTGKAYKHKGGRKTNEGDLDITDRGEYDQEGDMAKDSIKTVVRHAQALEKILSDNDNLPEWVQSKLAKIESMMTAVDDYMQNQEDDQGDDMPMGEESTVKRDNRAERAGKKVTKDIEYDEKKKEKKVAETTTSGSVATGGDAPKASKGGMQVGKGIYDSLNREVEGMIAESMSINVSMSTDDNGSHKNITVTAADEDAEMLAQLLRSAGLGGGMQHDHGHEEPCPDCGSTDCGCDQGMAEAYGDTDASQNEPNWPTDTEYSDDAMQYSGGLNGPKSTGQTTIPVIAHQGERTGVDDEELRRMMEMAGIQQDLKPWERTMKEAAVEEGVVDKVKDVVKKGLEKLGHGSDEDMRKDLQKKMGVPPTGEKPADKKMEESLMKEFANFKI